MDGPRWQSLEENDFDLRRRHVNRILAILLAVVAVASSGMARAANWHCDDGRPCVTGAKSCCPPDRGPGRCGAGGMACCASHATPSANQPAAHSCCAARPAVAAPAGGSVFRRAASCQCSASYLSRGAAVKQQPPPLLITAPAVLPVAAAALELAAIRAVAPPNTVTLPERLPTPYGGRAPPAS
jgi:hypothetical protein